jgi:hypothetical protein
VCRRAEGKGRRQRKERSHHAIGNEEGRTQHPLGQTATLPPPWRGALSRTMGRARPPDSGSDSCGPRLPQLGIWSSEPAIRGLPPRGQFKLGGEQRPRHAMLACPLDGLR